VCNHCGNYSLKREAIRTTCNRALVVSGESRRCAGVFLDARSDDDWSACATCAGGGTDILGRPCVGCRGFGGIFLKGNSRPADTQRPPDAV